MTYEEAAVVPVGVTQVLYYLRKAAIQQEERGLINSAGGSIGTYAVQLARYYGAEVTAVDSAAKLDMLRSLGADHVIDYTREDFSENGQTYDVIFDISGKSPFSRSLASLSKTGATFSDISLAFSLKPRTTRAKLPTSAGQCRAPEPTLRRWQTAAPQ